jgi:nitrite reductase/ring-hydroxylating ferredoxin subunit
VNGPRPTEPPEIERPRAGTVVCRLADLKSVGSKGISFGEGRFAFLMFVVRRNDEVYAYVNDCPHTRGPLEWLPDQFLDVERTHILCSRHGALFRFEDGLCVSAPCPGAHLTPVGIEIRDGDILIAG